MREPEAGLGSGWSTWFYSERPELFRHLPESTRIYRSRTALGPAGASWLRERVEGQFPILTSHVLDGAEEMADGVALTFRTPNGTTARLTADHVIAATGYRPDLERFTFLEPAIRKQLETVAGRARSAPRLPDVRAGPVCGRARRRRHDGAGHAVRVRCQARGAHGRPGCYRQHGQPVPVDHPGRTVTQWP